MVLDDLKAQVERIEGRTKRFIATGAVQPEPWTLGLGSLDSALPCPTNNGHRNSSKSSGKTSGKTSGKDNGKTSNESRGALPYDACHDFTPLVKTDVPQVAGFIAALLQRLPAQRLQRGPVVWCQTAGNAREYGRIYAPALLGGTLSPDRLLFVQVPKDRDLALVLEECVRVPRLAAVVGEGPAPDFTASRRLTLASQESHVPCLILNTGNDIAASAAATRWRVAPIVGPPNPLDPEGPGFAAWSLTLTRARGGNAALNPTLTKPLQASWNDETHTFNLVSTFRPGKALESQTPQDQVQRPGR